MDKTDKMIMDLTLKLNDDEKKYLLYIVHLVHKYEETFDKIKEWVLYQQQSNENLEPYILTDKLDDILELLEEVDG